MMSYSRIRKKVKMLGHLDTHPTKTVYDALAEIFDYAYEEGYKDGKKTMKTHKIKHEA